MLLSFEAMKAPVIPRFLTQSMRKRFGQNKVLLLFGTRRVGKTHLIRELAQGLPDTLIMNGEDFDVQSLLANRSAANYSRIIGTHKLLIIDEAQAIPDIGFILKLMIDTQPGLVILATGSSAFDLQNRTGEPLTGRSWHYLMYSPSIAEQANWESQLETMKALPHRLITGAYPEVLLLADADEQKEYLRELIQSYLLKDILIYEGIKNAHKIMALLRLVAWQIGSEVSYQELGKQLGLSRATVESYLDLLAKVSILFKLPAYSSNQRKEVSKGAKWYFMDNGIRNAVINDFKPLELRNDKGQLWENFLMSERRKQHELQQRGVAMYFWRNYNQQEIDLVEVSETGLQAFEFKFSAEKATKMPAAFASTYPGVPYRMVHQQNYMDWLIDDFERS